MLSIQFPHIVDLLQDKIADIEKPWLIVGKGPSFSSEFVSARAGTRNICCINNSVMALAIGSFVELVVVNDPSMIGTINRVKCPAKITAIATPSALHDNIPRKLHRQVIATSAIVQWMDQ